jgi:hypothetical protein
MVIIKFIQWAIGLILAFYLFKGLLGRFQEGDLTKAVIIGIIWFGLEFIKLKVI